MSASAPGSDPTRIRHDLLQHLRTVKPDLPEDDAAARGIKLRRVLDSLDMLEFIAFLEQNFAIRIQDSDVMSRNFETIDSVTAFVELKINSAFQRAAE
jgi:acyl carrier protein